MAILVINYVFNLTLAYSAQKRFVFRKGGNLLREYGRFAFLQGLFFIVNVVFLPLMVENFNFNPMLGQTLHALLVAVVGFFWHDKITLASRRTSKEAVKE